MKNKLEKGIWWQNMTRAKLFALIFCLSFIDQAQSKKIGDFDLNADKKIDLAEYTEFIKFIKSKPLGSFDLDGNGDLSPLELIQVNKELKVAKAAISRCVNIFSSENQHRNNQVSIIEFIDPCRDVSTQSSLPLGLMLRGDVDDIDLFQSATALKKANPLEIAYSKNSKSDSSEIRLKGAILRPWYLTKSKRSIIVPSLLFNQVRNRPDDGGDTNSLNFGLNTHWELNGVFTNISYLKLGAFYNTNTSFDRDIRGVNMSFEPVNIRRGLGAINSFGTSSYRISVQALSEFGEVVDPDGDETLSAGDDFLRLGAKLGLEIWPLGIDRLKANLEYLYLDSMSGDFRDRKYGSAKLSYSLDSSDSYTISAGYINGDRTVALEDEEAWSVGLGFKF